MRIPSYIVLLFCIWCELLSHRLYPSHEYMTLLVPKIEPSFVLLTFQSISYYYFVVESVSLQNHYS